MRYVCAYAVWLPKTLLHGGACDAAVQVVSVLHNTAALHLLLPSLGIAIAQMRQVQG